MLKALLNDFAALPAHEVVVMLDERCVAGFAAENIPIITLNATDNVLAIFKKNLNDCDAVWIIAPETDDVLLKFTQSVEKAHKLLVSNPSSAIIKTADKLQTFNSLTAHNILTIPTQYIPTQRLLELAVFENITHFIQFPLVVKARNGVGCEDSFVIQNQTEFHLAIKQINQDKNYIIQDFVEGDALSISTLFKDGKAHLICVNRQHIGIKNQQFKLSSCEVNIAVSDKTKFQTLLNKIAKAFPDLFGYVGIDLIVSESPTDNCYVVEINPRLTSSYSGIRQALGINVAELVLQSVNDWATINPLRNQTVFIDLVQE